MLGLPPLLKSTFLWTHESPIDSPSWAQETALTAPCPHCVRPGWVLHFYAMCSALLLPRCAGQGCCWKLQLGALHLLELSANTWVLMACTCCPKTHIDGSMKYSSGQVDNLAEQMFYAELRSATGRLPYQCKHTLAKCLLKAAMSFEAKLVNR